MISLFSFFFEVFERYSLLTLHNRHLNMSQLFARHFRSLNVKFDFFFVFDRSDLFFVDFDLSFVDVDFFFDNDVDVFAFDRAEFSFIDDDNVFAFDDFDLFRVDKNDDVFVFAFDSANSFVVFDDARVFAFDDVDAFVFDDDVFVFDRVETFVFDDDVFVFDRIDDVSNEFDDIDVVFRSRKQFFAIVIAFRDQ